MICASKHPPSFTKSSFRLDSSYHISCNSQAVSYTHLYHKDGIVAGFLCYPVEGFEGENQAEQILRFRDSLQAAILEHAGADAVTFLGGATGLYYGYLDFIAWDLPSVLDAAKDFLTDSEVNQGVFHVFRRDVGAVRLWEREAEPEVDPQTGSLLSAQDIETLESFTDDVAGYYGRMLHWLENFIEQGVQAGKFTQRQAKQDLQIALWLSLIHIYLREDTLFSSNRKLIMSARLLIGAVLVS